MKRVEVGDHLAANDFALFPELRLGNAPHAPRLSAESIQQYGEITCYNALVGYADSSMLLSADWELSRDHLAAGAFALQAQIELVQADCATPRPLLDIKDSQQVRMAPNPQAGRFERIGNIVVQKTAATLRQNLSRQQTERFMPFARSRLVGRRLEIANPDDFETVYNLTGRGLPREVHEAKISIAAFYERKKRSYWDTACDFVAHRQGRFAQAIKTFGKIDPQLHRSDLQAVLTDELDMTQFSMVLDAANPNISLSLLKNPPLLRNLAYSTGTFEKVFDVFDGMDRPRRSYHAMKRQAEQAVVEYAKKTRGISAFDIALLVAEWDRLNTIGYVPADAPNAWPVNLNRARRVVALNHIALVPQNAKLVPREIRDGLLTLADAITVKEARQRKKNR